MNTNYVIQAISKKNKGQFFNLSFISDVPMTAKAKRDGHIVLKYTHGTFRWGIKYRNLKSVKLREGEDSTKEHKLPWGEWSTEHPDLVINHKGKSYIRLYTTPNKTRSTYYLDGCPITKQELQELEMVQNSYWNKSEQLDCITVKTENIQDVF